MLKYGIAIVIFSMTVAIGFRSRQPKQFPTSSATWIGEKTGETNLPGRTSDPNALTSTGEFEDDDDSVHISFRYISTNTVITTGERDVNHVSYPSIKPDTGTPPPRA